MTEEIKKLKEQRDAIDRQITRLEATELQKATTFEEKLKVWYESDSGVNLRWLPSESEYPHLRKCIIENEDMDRYRNYDLRGWFEEVILDILEGNIDEVDENVLNTIKECTEKNIHSFTFDW